MTLLDVATITPVQLDGALPFATSATIESDDTLDKVVSSHCGTEVLFNLSPFPVSTLLNTFRLFTLVFLARSTSCAGDGAASEVLSSSTAFGWRLAQLSRVAGFRITFFLLSPASFEGTTSLPALAWKSLSFFVLAQSVNTIERRFDNCNCCSFLLLLTFDLREEYGVIFTIVSSIKVTSYSVLGAIFEHSPS